MSFGASATELGLASYYGAAGLTAAHRNLPMGSRVKVLNLDNGRSVILRIVDRGPFIRGRVIDVSTAAAEALGFRDAGLAHVTIDAISAETREPGPRPEPHPTTLEVSSYEICRYSAESLRHQQSDWLGGEAATMRSDMGCENVRSSRLFGLAERSEDLALRRHRRGILDPSGSRYQHPRERHRRGGGREHSRGRLAPRSGERSASDPPGNRLRRRVILRKRKAALGVELCCSPLHPASPHLRLDRRPANRWPCQRSLPGVNSRF